MRRFLIPAMLLAVVPGFAAAQDSPDVKQVGRYVAQWKDDKIQVVVGTRHANAHLTRPWLMLETMISANGDKPIRIDREDIALVVPGGTRVQLASQKAVTEQIPDVRKMYTEAAITQDPMEGYFVGRTQKTRLGFFSPPTERIVYDQVTTDRTMIAQGYLFFRSPSGGSFPPGRYVLEVFNKDVDVKLPFMLTGDKKPPKEGEKGDKTVPW